MGKTQELHKNISKARKARNESANDEAFDYWHAEIERLTNELREGGK